VSRNSPFGKNVQQAYKPDRPIIAKAKKPKKK